MKLFEILIGDPFGGYSVYETDLTEQKADRLLEELLQSDELDYFTVALKVEKKHYE